MALPSAHAAVRPGHARPPVRVLVPLSIDALAPPPLGQRAHRLEGTSMGTVWQVLLSAPAGADTRRWRGIIDAELERVDAQMSTWRADSDLMRFNGAAPGSRHGLPDAFAEVLDCALAVAAASEGAFDPAAGALVTLWGFGASHRHDAPGFRRPDAATIAQAMATAGWRALRPAGDAIVQPGGVQLDLSAIAKGHAVDRIADRLAREPGVSGVLVEIGGELHGHGLRPDGQPWWVEVERPALPAQEAHAEALPITRVALHGLAVATSGDYRRFFVDADGRRHPHTIDPRTGAPVRHGVASVTVVAPRCMLADAWSTALTVLGPQEGPALAARAGIAALFVTRDDDGRYRESLSPAMAELAA